jgi:hypothetical protein
VAPAPFSALASSGDGPVIETAGEATAGALDGAAEAAGVVGLAATAAGAAVGGAGCAAGEHAAESVSSASNNDFSPSLCIAPHRSVRAVSTG